MSAIAIDLMDRLRKSGMADEHARQIAEAFDARVEEALNEAKRHAEQVSERAAEKADAKSEAKYATKTEVETREKQFTRREDSESQYARLCGEIEKLWDAVKELRGDIKELRGDIQELHADNRGIHKELQYLRWGVGLIVVILLTDLVDKFLS